MIRDAALAASGLLDRRIGGPPVRPYQPPGIWSDPFMGRLTYEPSLGRDRFRRTLYAFWRRNVAPSFLFLACEDSSYMTGQVLHPNGGYIVNG